MHRKNLSLSKFVVANAATPSLNEGESTPFKKSLRNFGD